MSQSEQLLLEAVKTLPPQRVNQVLDFARWLQTQPATEEVEGEESTEAELEAEEAAWQRTYMANREEFRSMARQALADLDAGETLEMVIEDDKIYPR